MDGSRPWESRLLRIIRIVEWGSLAIGMMVAVATTPDLVVALGAAGLSAVWVLAATAVPPSISTRPLAIDVISLAGVVLTMTSVTLTGGASSGFLLMSLAPVIRAGALGGRRAGITSGMLAGALLGAIGLAQAQGVADFEITTALLSLLHPFAGAVVGQIRFLLEDLSKRVATAEATSFESVQRLESIENASALLHRLADIAGSNQLNVVEIGADALQAILERHPDSSGRAVLHTESQPIVVAQAGEHTTGVTNRIPLVVSGLETGHVELLTRLPIGKAELDLLEESLRPLALAFGNAKMLQQIAQTAVKEERTRVARELHDEIGPTLSSLGLAIDVALLQGVDNRVLADHLSSLRDQVGRLVDDVRTSVADLRTPPAPSVIAYVQSMRSSLPTEFEVELSLDERRPPRPSLTEDLFGVIGEALRNAAQHSGAATAQISGWVDFDRGRIVVTDNGSGFKALETPKGRFGLIGMEERAIRAGLKLAVNSSGSGTQVAIEWGTDA